MKQPKKKLGAYVCLFIVGFVIQALIGQVGLAPASIIAFLWMFLSGLLAKKYIQSLQSPFTGKPKSEQSAEWIIRNTEIISTLSIVLSLGAIFAEIILFEALGTISLAVLFFGLGIKASEEQTEVFSD